MKILLLLLAALPLTGCIHGPAASSAPVVAGAEPASPPIRNRTVGSWVNLYQGAPRLAGVSVNQFGDNPLEATQYEGKHPEGVWFYFWDGRVRMVTYDPEGAVTTDQWRAQRIKPGAAE